MPPKIAAPTPTARSGLRNPAPAAPETASPAAGRLRHLPLAALALAALGGILLLGDRIEFDTLRDNRDLLLAWRDDRYLATAAGFVALYTLVVALSLPGATVLTLTGGFLFGIWPGTALNALAATLGASALFAAVRLGPGRGVAARLDQGTGRIHRLKAALDDNQWSMLFTLRLLPIVPFFVANLLPALVGVPLHRFVVTTFLGILPAGLVFTSIGAGLGEVFDRGGTPDLGVIFTPHILLPLLGLALLSALPMLRAAWIGREGA